MQIQRILLLLSLTVGVKAFAQQPDPAHFSYGVKDTGPKKYEITISVTLDNGWHIYSQTQPAEAIAQPTKITFNKNPLIIISGIPKEIGKKEKYEDKASGIVQYQYGRKVDFVQSFTLKAKAKTKLSGNITYQVCTDERCLMPKTVPFSVQIE